MTAARVALDDPPAIDPSSLAGADGWLLQSDRLTLVGLGTAAVLPLPMGLDDPAALDAVVAALASVECDDTLTTAERQGIPAPVLAFGALPFERSAAAALVVPQLVVGTSESGTTWCTVVSADEPARPPSPEQVHQWVSDRVPARVEPNAGPAVEAIVPRTSDDDFERCIATALEAIDRGELAKVVLARQMAVMLGSTVDIPALLRRWHRIEPRCTIFSMPAADGRFLGASPELLVERTGSRVRSRPLAGTAGRPDAAPGGGRPPDLLESPKDVAEHRLVVDAIVGALRSLSCDLDAPSRPEVVRLRSMTHLGTDIVGTLDTRADGSIPHVLELLAALHPTPAVGGVPLAPARALIDRLEPDGRGAFAGPVGFVDGKGDGRWVVGIRSMTLRGREALLAAGVGVVEGSEPSAERIEADLKLDAVLEALAPVADTATSVTPLRASIR